MIKTGVRFQKKPRAAVPRSGDSLATGPFDRLLRLAQKLLGMPVAVIVLDDGLSCWSRSSRGLSRPDPASCRFLAQRILLASNPLLVKDTTRDPEFARQPLVTQRPFFRFCAGVALKNRAGARVGSLAVLDIRPRRLSSEQQKTLGDLGAVAEAELEVIEKEEALENLRQTHSELLRVLEDTHDLVQTTSVDGKIEFVNSAWRSALGYAEAELAGLDISSVVHPRAQEAYAEAMQSLILGERLTGFETTFLTKDGRELALSGNFQRLYRNGTLEGIQGIFRDISLPVRAREELARARDAALELVRVKSEFIANMSHEIRTPLNAIVGMTNLLQETPLSLQQQDFVSIVKDASEVLLAIVNDVLDFSKMEASEMALELGDFDLRELMEGSVELLSARAHSKNLELICEIPPGMPTGCHGDFRKIRHVVINLLSNAVKFTETGEVRLSARPVEESDTQVLLRIEVIDTGIGISREGQARLFRAFAQVDTSTSRKYGGTGLGLAISKKLVELMGGEIGLESRPEEGSNFWFQVPLQKSPGAAPELLPDPRLAGLRVLILDGNANCRLVLERQLSRWGVRCTSIGAPGEVIPLMLREAMGEDPFRVVLLATNFSDLKGLTLAQKIQSYPGLSDCHLLLMAGLGQSFTSDEAHYLNIAGYVSKPFRRDALHAALVRTLSAGEAPTAPVSRPGPQREVGRFRVLVVEDNPVNRKVVVLQLQKLGYSVEAVDGAAAALEALSRDVFNLVLMDCHMPETDGYTLTGEIRRRGGSNQHAVIVAMTANVIEGDRQRCLAAGMDDYLPKPIRRDDLAGVLAHWDAPLDDTVLREISTLDDQVVPELIDMFLAQAPECLQKIRRALAEQDPAALKLSAHTLKGDCLNLGAGRLRVLSARMERMAQNGRLEGGAELADSLEEELENVRLALRSTWPA